MNWHKSSYSSGNGGNCVEVAASWRKSSYSGGREPNCVEVGEGPGTVKVRDTANRHLGQLTLPANEWAAFLTELRDGQL